MSSNVVSWRPGDEILRGSSERDDDETGRALSSASSVEGMIDGEISAWAGAEVGAGAAFPK